MEKTIIDGKMIKEYLGINDGYRVKIKRNAEVYRQRKKGERWEFIGRTPRIAWKYAKEHNIKKWRLSNVLEFDSLFDTVGTFQKNGFKRGKDMHNLLKMGLNQCFGDIYRNGKIFIVGNSPREPEDAIFFDNTQCEEMAFIARPSEAENQTNGAGCDGGAGNKGGKMDLNKILVQIFEKDEFPPEHNIKQRHLHRFSPFQDIGDGKYQFSIVRHPTINGSCQRCESGLTGFIEEKEIFILDTQKIEITFKESEYLGAEINYNLLAQYDAENTVDIYCNEIEKIHSKKELMEFAKTEAERLEWEVVFQDEIETTKEKYPEFEFDWTCYLNLVKKHFISLMVEKWESEQPLKIVKCSHAENDDQKPGIIDRN